MGITHKTKGTIYVLLSCMMFTFVAAINRHFLSPDIPILLKVFFRALFGFVFFIPFIMHDFPGIFKTKSPFLHFIRVVLSCIAVGTTYYAYTHLPMNVALSIGFTGPIITPILSMIILKDHMQVDQWMMILLGYLGIVLIINPFGESINNAIWVSIMGNIATSLAVITIRKLTFTDKRTTIMVYVNIGLLISSSLALLFYWLIDLYTNPMHDVIWIMPNLKDFIGLILVGLFGTLNQVLYVSALKYADPSFLSPFEYSRLVMGIPIGIYLGDALPDSYQWVGTIIIILSTLYLTWKGLKK